MKETQVKLDKQEAQIRNKFLEMFQNEKKAQSREKILTEREKMLSNKEVKLREYQGMQGYLAKALLPLSNYGSGVRIGCGK